MANGDCTVGATCTANITNITERLTTMHEVDQDQWDAINRIQNRLPVWATFVMSGLTGIIGVLVTLLVS